MRWGVSTRRGIFQRFVWSPDGYSLADFPYVAADLNVLELELGASLWNMRLAGSQWVRPDSQPTTRLEAHIRVVRCFSAYSDQHRRSGARERPRVSGGSFHHTTNSCRAKSLRNRSDLSQSTSSLASPQTSQPVLLVSERS